MTNLIPPFPPFFNSYNRLGWLIVAAATVFWLGETWIFGWNLKPQSEAERYCDSMALMAWSLGWGYIAATSRVNVQTIFREEMIRWTIWFKENPMEKINATENSKGN